MKPTDTRRTPVLVAAAVIVLVCALACVRLGLFERPELMTFDWRVRLAKGHSVEVATNLGVVKMTDDTLDAVKQGMAFMPWGTNEAGAGIPLGLRHGLYWPRHVYGRVVRELAAQGAETVGFDVLLAELRDDYNPINVRGLLRQATNDVFLQQFVKSGEVLGLFDDQVQITPDAYFALQLHAASNIVLAATSEKVPPALFRTNAVALGGISAERDKDGVLRRARAFWIHTNWHEAFLLAEREMGVMLSKSIVGKDKIRLLTRSGGEVDVPLDAEGNFDLTLFAGEQLPPGFTRKNKPYTEERLWNLGLVLGARALNLDLMSADVDHKHRRIVFPGLNGIKRTVPVDKDGWFYIDWELRSEDSRLTTESLESLLARDQLRLQGHTDPASEKWKGKLVVVGSEATGNDLTDRGATPLEEDIPLMTKHWNVANSLIQGRFVTRAGLGMELGVIVLLGAISALLTMRLRILLALFAVLATVGAYAALAVRVYVAHRYWLPMVLPICGAGFVEYAILATYRVIFEQDEKRKVKSLFSRLVSPNIVNELLQVKHLALGGARREITVLFADVRGFTELTDRAYEKALGEIARQKLGPEEAKWHLDEAARHTLETVNLYLGMLADIVKRHDGTLDKYIGDCVMAFWGAPSPQPQHAAACVRAAIDAQRAIYRLNQTRQAENERNPMVNKDRESSSASPLPLLQMGSGINTGLSSVGLMGSDEHIYNYTVFGREVNLASRLESLSGRGRIIIGETTFKHLQRDAPDLAATCKTLEPERVKGFRDPVPVFEVPWQEAAMNLTPGTPAKADTETGRLKSEPTPG